MMSYETLTNKITFLTEELFYANHYAIEARAKADDAFAVEMEDDVKAIQTRINDLSTTRAKLYGDPTERVS